MNHPGVSSEAVIQQNNNTNSTITNNPLLPVQPGTTQQTNQMQQSMGVPQQVQYHSQSQQLQQPTQPQQQAQVQQPQQQQQQQLQAQQPQQQAQQQAQQHGGYLQQQTQQQNQQQQVQQVQQQQVQQQQQPQVQQVSGQPGQQVQRHAMPAGYVGGWQSDAYVADRTKMIKKIVNLLKARKPNAPREWLVKLPQMAKRLEETLFKSAPDFNSYNNPDTLKQRLQQLAMRMKNPRRAQQQRTQQMQQQNQQNIQMVNQQGMTQIPGQQAQQQQQQPQQQAQQLQAQPQQPQHQRVVNMSDINPIMGKSQNNTSQQTQNSSGLPQVTHNNYVQQNNNMNGTVQTNPAQKVVSQNGAQQYQQQQQQQPQQTQSNATAQNGNSRSRSGSDRAQVLRHQQQRLLLLRHAAKCPHEDGRCPVTPHCSGMKRLWKHIAECKNQKCQVPHCVSSRYVLSHYHRCKDVRCPVCGPVREAIHRSHEKQKQIANMSVLKQGHNNAMQQQQVQPQQQQPPQQPQVQQQMQQVQSQMQQQVQQQPQQPQQQMQQIQPQQQQQPIVQSSSVIQPPNKRRKVGPSMSTSMPTNQLQQHTQPYAPGSMQQNTMKAVSSHSSGTVVQSGFAYGARLDKKQISIPKPIAKRQEDLTLINCFTIEQIETHIKSLNQGLRLPPAKLKSKCLEVLKLLQSHQHGWVFNTPVDPVELGLPDYFQVIKKPMDLGTIKKRLENGCYSSLQNFHADVQLTFDNAMLYNPEGSVVYNMAKEMKDKFAAHYTDLIRLLKMEEDQKRKSGDACALCGNEKLLFEPPVFYCNGLKCGSARIRRNSFYYVAGKNKYHWCHTCYGDLKENQEIQMPLGTFKKQDLVKKKNDEVREESWVHCDKCQRWIHQICGLFNTRKNSDQNTEYVCPSCTIADRKRRGIKEGTSSTPMAEDLQRTKLSEFLEGHIRVKSKEYFEKAATEKAEADNISIEEAHKKIERGGHITIRQVTSTDRKLEVLDKMKKRYAFKNYPTEFSFRCKCIIVFQNLDGVDVILFGMYVYEHGDDNPQPNKRVVYLSYLDSVHFMRPREMRTHIYHEILVAYLEYVRRKGLEKVHIWACPPGKGDDYILYAKPESQKTPREDRLRQWYYNMLTEAQRRGIVGKVTNMYDLYFSNKKNDATCVPYLDGDYFPGEVENTIRAMEEGKLNKKSNSEKGKKKKKTTKNKNKSGRGGTRSTGLDEEALEASGVLPAGYDQKSIEKGDQDYVMARVGEIIAPMKDNFIVAYLACTGAKKENMVVPKKIVEYREKHGVKSKHEAVGSSQKMKSEDDKKIKKENGAANGSNNGSSQNAVAVKKETNQSQSDANAEKQKQNPVLAAREGKFAAMEARKRSIEGQIKSEGTKSVLKKDDKKGKKSPTTITVKDSKGRLVKVLDDDVEEMDCEFLNTRQLFLELCQTNNYQYDQIRRAKHSSMMVLFHLHNRDAPKFVQQCAVCAREILSGYRYHCPTCADFDLCSECYVKSERGQIQRHQHILKKIPIQTDGKNQQTEEQRKERQRSIQLHMTLLLHAASCNSPSCQSQNCAKMKSLLKHGETCPTKTSGGCNVCKRIYTLLQIHARGCKDPKCPVPKCLAFRQRFRQLALQQRAMDDRRRQHMNSQYRATHAN